MHQYQGGFGFFIQCLVAVIIGASLWWRDVLRESTAEGSHTRQVQEGLKEGMVLFIVSEVMFFFGFFWAFFNSWINPAIQIYGSWPPMGIQALSAWDVPFLNTLLLLTSGTTITWCHHAIIRGEASPALSGLAYTILLAMVFTFFQGVEYLNASFSISDTVFGSSFFMATGFHGFHVFIGTLFLTVCFFRLRSSHFTKQHHFGFEAAAWYWHFVDVVWLFLFVVIYWLGTLSAPLGCKKDLSDILASFYNIEAALKDEQIIFYHNVADPVLKKAQLRNLFYTSLMYKYKIPGGNYFFPYRKMVKVNYGENEWEEIEVFLDTLLESGVEGNSVYSQQLN
jgi:heme/copper-type cytochrome/quinol oxidase subunit 3